MCKIIEGQNIYLSRDIIAIIGSIINKTDTKIFSNFLLVVIKGTVSQPKYTTTLYSILSNNYLILLLLDKTLVSPNFQVIKI